MRAVDARGHLHPLCRLGCPHHARADRELRPALAGAPHATAGQVWNLYAGAFAGRAEVSPGPAITLAWTGYFVLLAIIANGRAYAHIRTTCVFALIGLVGFWIDAAARQDKGDRAMRRRLLVIGGTLIAAAIYFRVRPGA